MWPTFLGLVLFDNMPSLQLYIVMLRLYESIEHYKTDTKLDISALQHFYHISRLVSSLDMFLFHAWTIISHNINNSLNCQNNLDYCYV